MSEQQAGDLESRDYAVSVHLPKHGSMTSDNVVVFLQKELADGSLLGWFSHSPWGLQMDQEQGWVLLSPDFEVIDSVATVAMGRHTGEGREWFRRVKEQHGATKTRFTKKHNNELRWKKGDN